jgi:hypothetical protein
MICAGSASSGGHQHPDDGSESGRLGYFCSVELPDETVGELLALAGVALAHDGLGDALNEV